MKALKGLMVLALTVAAACDGAPTAGSALVARNGGQTAQSPGVLTFASRPSHTEQTPQTASGGLAGIDFTGTLATGTPCYTVSATHDTRGSDVTVTVTGTSTGGICAQVVTYHNYTGRVSALLPGTYNLIVLHQVRTTTTTAYSGTVTVQ